MKLFYILLFFFLVSCLGKVEMNNLNEETNEKLFCGTYNNQALIDKSVLVYPEDELGFEIQDFINSKGGDHIYAITICNYIFLNSPWLDLSDQDQLAIIVHELKHVEQADKNCTEFQSKYLLSFLKNKMKGKNNFDSYWDLKQEREARKWESRFKAHCYNDGANGGSF